MVHQSADLQELLSDLTGATIGIHSDRRASASVIDVRAGADAAGNNAIEAMVLAHGMLNTMVVFVQTEKPIMWFQILNTSHRAHRDFNQIGR